MYLNIGGLLFGVFLLDDLVLLWVLRLVHTVLTLRVLETSAVCFQVLVLGQLLVFEVRRWLHAFNLLLLLWHIEAQDS
jgi:hypothetical protein